MFVASITTSASNSGKESAVTSNPVERETCRARIPSASQARWIATPEAPPPTITACMRISHPSTNVETI